MRGDQLEGPSLGRFDFGADNLGSPRLGKDLTGNQALGPGVNMFYAHLAEIHNRQNPAVAFFGNICEVVMMCGTVENRFVEWRATVAVCQDSEKKRILDVRVRLFGGSSGTVC